MSRKQPKLNAAVSSDCFRLLRLTQEVQSDVKVLKAVVDEVDVLRLCRVLGMAVSDEDDQVAKRNFEFGLFHASDYDADFARFVRDNLKATNQDDEHQLEVGCLFGKQLDVKEELVRMGYWSKCEEGLFFRNQGVYCIEGGGNPMQLVVFAWLDACLFEPDAIRSTPAYVLRFLISLSPNITCCLSEDDFRLMKSEMDTKPDNSNMKWKSCSFAFRVQKQIEQKDNVACGSITKTQLPRCGDAKAAWLVGGAFPAVAVEKSTPSTSEWVSHYDIIPCESFGDWLMQKKSRGFTIDFRPAVRKDPRNRLLHEFGQFPDEELDALQAQFRQQEEEAKERLYYESFDVSKRVYDETILDACFLFAARTPANSAQMDSAQQRYAKLLFEWDQNDMLKMMDLGMHSLLYLPDRVQTHMKELETAFLRHPLAFEDALHAIVNGEPINSNESNWIWGYFVHTARHFLRNDQFNYQFCFAMQEQQTQLTDFWANAVRNIVTVMQDVTFKQRVEEFIHDNQYRYTLAEDTVLQNAFEEFRKYLNSGEGHLSIKILKLWCSSDGDTLNVTWGEEVEKEPRKVIRMYRLSSTGSPIETLGTLKFGAGLKLLELATVKQDHAVAILLEGNGTIVKRIRFSQQGRQKVEQFPVRKFPRRCSLCSVRDKDRTIAFLFEASGGRLGDVAFCKFNESFTSVESTRFINMDTSFGLTSPIVDILLTERSLCAVDGNGNFQSFDTRTRRTSKKVPIGNSNWVGSLMSFADELVVGRVQLDENRQLCLYSISDEDHRALPSVAIGLEAPSKRLAVGSVGDVLYVVNSDERLVYSTMLTVTVQSDAYRIQRSGKGPGGKQRWLQGDHSSKEAADSHWLRVFYHSFEKFPVRSLLDMSMDPSTVVSLALTVAVAGTRWSTEEVGAVCSKYFRNVMADLRRLNKPLAELDLAQNLKCLEQRDGPSLQTISIRCILLAVVAFVPVQICRAEENMLQLLRDGEDTSSSGKEPSETRSEDSEGSSSADASEIARSIRFGLLSPLLESWNGRCAVVTSMGKQSTGKSYFLNHLTGTSFAISGARCTDGAWMSLRFTSADTLLVVLDFEGLGSFERSEQEYIFLSVLNAAVSLFTVFRIDSRFDKDIDGLFSRFQKGARLIKDDPRLFRGLLYMNIKDVNMDDQQDVTTELVEKLDSIFVANKEQNFLTDMYAGQLEINCSPPFGTIDYYQCMENDAAVTLQKIMLPSSNEPAGFVTGKAFLDCLRIVLAKISILDWTSMGKSSKNLIVADTKQKLAGVLRTGCHVSLPLVEELVIPSHLKEEVLRLGSQEKLVISFQQMCEANPTYKTKWMALNDFILLDDVKDEDFDVGFDATSLSDKKMDLVQNTIGNLFQFFLQRSGKTYGQSRLTTKDQSDFDTFTAFVLRRRKTKVSRWLQGSLGDQLADERTHLEQRYLEPLVIYLSRCQQRCSTCQLGCMLSMTHSSSDIDHSCCTDHQCRGKCEYGECQGKSELTPPCSRNAGHEEKCECDKGDHTCGQPCALARALNCDKTCVKRPEHDGEHCCSVQVHVCGAKCSAASCSATCLLDMQREHTVHKCAEVQCIHPCLMNSCKSLCGVKDHFHGQAVQSRTFAEESGGMCTEGDDSPVTHMCAGSHSCGGMCAVDGICEQKVHLKKSTQTYTGAHGSFEYVHHEMNGCKKHCARILLRGDVSHNGFGHSCLADGEQNTVHYCDARCPSCSYYCNKQFGHLGLHATSHGNMEQTYFVAKANDIVIESRQYQAGERGNAEMCNLFCSKMGRGHAHYLQCECEDPTKCVYAANGNADQRRHCVDKLLPPPDKAMDEVLHAKFWESIGWEDPCSEEERALFTKCPFRCDAPEHEEGENQPSYCVLDAWHLPEVKPETDDGFAHVDGHKFECVHAVESGKFHNIFVLDSSGSMGGQPWENLLRACNEFSWNRWKDGGGGDIVSYISFSHECCIHCEEAPLSECLNVGIPYSGGGTYFEEGLRAANEVLSRNDFQEFKAVLIFFSDGRPADVELGITLARHIRAAYAKYDVKAFVVGFGCVNLSVLERMAAEMGGEYRQALDADALRSEFKRIAAVLCSSEASLALKSAP